MADVSNALKMMPYGLYSITSRRDDTMNAMVANWVMQASYEPRLVVIGLQKSSFTYGLVQAGRVFAVNIFKAEDAEAIKPYTKSRAKNPDKMNGVDYQPAPQTGCPILPEAAAYVECRVQKIVDTGGDHDLVLGEVVGGDVMKPGDAGESLTLPYLGWSYAG